MPQQKLFNRYIVVVRAVLTIKKNQVMKKIYFISIIICQIFLVSCANEQGEKYKNNPVNNSEPQTTYNFLYKGETKYAKIINHDTKLVGYISEKHNSLADEHLVLMDGIDRPISAKKANIQRAKQSVASELMLKINGTDAKEIKAQRKTSQVQKMRANGSSLFGNTVSFSLSRTINAKDVDENGIQKAPASVEENVTMYVPELVHIISPKIETAEELLPYCYYKNFVLKWNADQQNENGLVVAVEWTGSDMFGKNHGNYVMNADIIPIDDGVCVLDDRLFDDIPHAAKANIILIRGNIEVLEDFINENGEEEAYRIAAASEAVLPFIMVKEIKLLEE